MSTTRRRRLSFTPTKYHHRAPLRLATLSDEEWIKVELSMKDLILAVSITTLLCSGSLALTLTCRTLANGIVSYRLPDSSEIRDIILGQEIAAPSVQPSKWPNWKRVTRPRPRSPPCRRKLPALLFAASTNVPYSQTTNIHGDAIQTVTSERLF